MREWKVSIGEKGYPSLLGHIYKPPASLNIRGELPDFDENPPIAVVGSRKPSDYGREITAALVKGLVKAGFCVISGLAYGIDSEAHRCALENKGLTIAVLGSGLDNVYPPAHKKLAEEIVEKGGAVISEYAATELPLKHHFPERNRIVCGMSLGVVIVEATLDSGTLISARLAMEQGREVFAVPGMAAHVNSQGPHKLLKEGACLVESAQDVIDALEPKLSVKWKAKFSGQTFGIGVKELKILDALTEEPVPVDTVVEKCGLLPSEVLAGLTLLEVAGLVANKDGKGYLRQRTND